MQFLHFRVSPGSAEALVRWDGKIKQSSFGFLLSQKHFCQKLSNPFVHVSYSAMPGRAPSGNNSGKLLTPMCLCSPSSIIWYLARASCLMRCHVAAIHGYNEQGKYCSSGFTAFSRLNCDINYLLYFALLSKLSSFLANPVQYTYRCCDNK